LKQTQNFKRILTEFSNHELKSFKEHFLLELSTIESVYLMRYAALKQDHITAIVHLSKA